MKILFVCDGNICRSPMAEALMRQQVEERSIDWPEVSSGGLVASPWGVAHSQLCRVLGHSYKLVENRHSQPLTKELVDGSDIILGMEDRHVSQILKRFTASQSTVDKMTSYAGRKGEIKDFPESGYGDVAGWLHHCHQVMVPCIETILSRVIRERAWPMAH